MCCSDCCCCCCSWPLNGAASLHFLPAASCAPSGRTDAGVCVSPSLHSQVSPSRAALNRLGLLLLIRFSLPSICMFCSIYMRGISKRCAGQIYLQSARLNTCCRVSAQSIRSHMCVLPAVSPQSMLHLGILSYLYAQHVVEYLLQNKPLSVAFLLAYCEQCASRDISPASLEFQWVTMGDREGEGWQTE